MIKELNTTKFCEGLIDVIADLQEFNNYEEISDKITLLINIYIYLESLKENLAKNIIILELKQEKVIE